MKCPSPPTIFVVDDDQAVRDSLRALLGSVGFKVRAFASGDELLAAHDPSQAACLVLDVHMPGMSGLEIQQKLAARGISVPVIVISDCGNAKLAASAVRAGAVDYLEKPISGQALIASIRRALKGRVDSDP